MEIIQTALKFFAENTASVLLVVAILYFIILAIKIIYSRKSGGSFTFRWKYVIAFLLIIGLAIYSLITGKNLNEFIG